MAISPAMSPEDEALMEGETIEVEIGETDDTDDMLEQPQEAPGHYDNLAELLEDEALASIGTELQDLFEADEGSRRDWLQTYVDGLDYLGFDTTERNEPFKGASGVFHPVLSEAVVRFQSNAIMEIFPAAGPVMTRIVGPDTEEKTLQSMRVKEELNYQLTEEMVEYRNETEQMLFRLPLAGSVFKKVYFDPLRNRPAAIMVPAEDFVIDYAATDIEYAERCCHIIRKSANEIKKLQRAGFYRQCDIGSPVPYQSPGREKEGELSGVVDRTDRDSRHTLLEFHVNYNLPEPFNDEDDIADPYVITIVKGSGKVLSIRRNWAEEDAARNPEQYFVHYQYMPGLGFYGIGLIHLLGSIAKSSTSILRQLIDAGTFSNLPGGLKTRGLRTKGEDTPIKPGEWRDVDVPAGGIRDNLFPLPYKEPSVVLAQLLQNLVTEGRRIGSIADVEIGSMSENAPVGTTLALMERSMKVMSAVHARLHASLRRELKLVAKVIHDYMGPRYAWDAEGKFDRTMDFDGRVDILPVSDPNAATQAQRIVQLQAVMQLAQQNPELYNLKELHRQGLHAIGIKNDERILPRDQDPPRLDPIQENMAILTGEPTKVYQDQDHAAHIQAHMAAMTDPKIVDMVSKSPRAPMIQGAMEAHIAEHFAFQYRSEIEQALGVELPPLGQELPPEVETRLSRLVAGAAVEVRKMHEGEMAREKAQALEEDPVFQLRKREVALKEAEFIHRQQMDMIEKNVDIAKYASKEQLDIRRIESNEAIAGANIGANLVTFGAKLESDERREGVKLGKEVAEGIRDDQRRVQEMEQRANERRAQIEARSRNSGQG